MKRLNLLYLLLIPFSLLASGDPVPVEEPYVPPQDKPWFTGPLLTPSPWVVRYGYTNLEPYIFYRTFPGSYDNNWNYRSSPTRTALTWQLVAYVGVSEKVAFKFTPGFQWRRRQGQGSLNYVDLPLEFNFQLYKESDATPWPSIKLVVGETLPTGIYQRLNPRKLGTDASGNGSFQTVLGLIFGRAYPLRGMNWFRYRTYLSYVYGGPVHVRGYNAYGGGIGTAGKVYPGHTFRFFLGLEYSLTQRWVLALDVRAIWQGDTSFSGTRGVTSSGALASVGGKANQNYSLAPAIEYSFNKKMGLVAGPWFSVAGKNSSKFLNWAIAFNYFN